MCYLTNQFPHDRLLFFAEAKRAVMASDAELDSHQVSMLKADLEDTQRALDKAQHELEMLRNAGSPKSQGGARAVTPNRSGEDEGVGNDDVRGGTRVEACDQGVNTDVHMHPDVDFVESTEEMETVLQLLRLLFFRCFVPSRS